MKVKYYVDSGADMVDIGMHAGENKPQKAYHMIKTIKDINNKGCYNYHSLNRDMYNKCLHLAKDAGVQLLYTKLPYSISFTDNVCYHADAQKIVEISSVPP